MKAIILKGVSVVLGLFILSCCSPCGEPSGQNKYMLSNQVDFDINIIRYRKENNSIDSIHLPAYGNYSEIGKSSFVGDKGHEYSYWFDSVRVVYKDSIYITHNLNNTFLLSENILGASVWEVIDNNEKDCLNTRTFEFAFDTSNFEEAKLKGKKVQ